MAHKLKAIKKYGPASIKGKPIPPKPVLVTEDPTISTGDLSLFLDDERPCPPGWICARDPRAFMKIIDEHGPRIKHLSLDWHLGTGISNGEKVVDWLIEGFRSDPGFLPNLELTYFHSSDWTMAKTMLRNFEKGVPEGREIMTTISLPRNTHL